MLAEVQRELEVASKQSSTFRDTKQATDILSFLTDTFVPRYREFEQHFAIAAPRPDRRDGVWRRHGGVLQELHQKHV